MCDGSNGREQQEETEFSRTGADLTVDVMVGMMAGVTVDVTAALPPQAADLLIGAVARDASAGLDSASGAGKRERAEGIVWRLLREKAVREAQAIEWREREAQLYLKRLQNLEQAGDVTVNTAVGVTPGVNLTTNGRCDGTCS